MATIRPFRALRPSDAYRERIPALPYDVYSEAEARAYAAAHPDSFLTIDRPETMFPEGQDPYADEVYKKADKTFRKWIREGRLIREEKPCYYLYEQTMDGRVQSGFVACSAVDDYLNGVILKHEKTRAEKEKDRIRHVDALSCQTGPIFLAYRPVRRLKEIAKAVRETGPLYDLTGEDSVRHRVFRIADRATVEEITKAFAAVPHTYIADGHHRAASAVKVALMRRKAKPAYTGKEEFNYFLSVLFPADELCILPYNRVVKETKLHSPEEAEKCLKKVCDLEKPSGKAEKPGKAAKPAEKGMICVYCRGKWIKARFKKKYRSDDAVRGLDVSILQDQLLAPAFQIKNPRTNRRIAFVGGIRGPEELEKRAGDKGIAFSMYPPTMEELLRVADEGRLMPPKSTWFEPKLRSGFFMHLIER